MKHNKGNKRQARLKAVGVAVAALVVGVGLLVLSRYEARAAEAVAASQPASTTQPAASQPTSTQPSTSPAGTDGTPPAKSSTNGQGGKETRPDSRVAVHQRMAALLLLFSLMGFGVAVVAVGWIVYDIRASRPAWMTQTKYPVRIPPKKLKK